MVKRTISHYCAAVKVCVMALARVSKCFFLQNSSKHFEIKHFEGIYFPKIIFFN